MIDQFDRVDSKIRGPTAISLFAGAGGCSLGFQQAGYDIPFAADIDMDAVGSYCRNFGKNACEATDIRELGVESALERIGLERGELDILLGGPPCQGFSSAGVKSSDDPRNFLLRHYVRLLEGIRPKWFVMENVEGLLTNAGGLHLRDAVEVFLEAGYSVNVEKVYAQGYGVPQRRKRVLIVGNRLGHDFLFPEPVTRFSGSIFRKGEVTFLTATSDLPPCDTECGVRALLPRGGAQRTPGLFAWRSKNCHRPLRTRAVRNPIGACARIAAWADHEGFAGGLAA